MMARSLEDQEALHKMKLARLRADIQAGLESGAATPLDMEEVKAEGRRLRAASLAERRACADFDTFDRIMARFADCTEMTCSTSQCSTIFPCSPRQKISMPTLTLSPSHTK